MPKKTGYEIKHWGVKGMKWDPEFLKKKAQEAKNALGLGKKKKSSGLHTYEKVITPDMRAYANEYNRQMREKEMDSAANKAIKKEPALGSFTNRTIVDVANDKKKGINAARQKKNAAESATNAKRNQQQMAKEAQTRYKYAYEGDGQSDRIDKLAKVKRGILADPMSKSKSEHIRGTSGTKALGKYNQKSESAGEDGANYYKKAVDYEKSGKHTPPKKKPIKSPSLANKVLSYFFKKKK